MLELDQILADIKQAEVVSEMRSHWNPGYVGNVDIRIAADGSWFHEGRLFQRQSMIKLFSSVLFREGDEYFLLTPAEKLKIQVDDAPFVATLVDTIEENKQSAIVFTTNFGDRILLDAEHAIRVEVDQQNQTPRPYVHIRDGLEALISRSAFFDLANLAEEQERDGKLYLTISSLGQEFDLGCIDPLEAA